MNESMIKRLCVALETVGKSLKGIDAELQRLNDICQESNDLMRNEVVEYDDLNNTPLDS